MTGQVVALIPANRQVRLAHDDVPGYMDKMTMPFTVRDVKDLEGLAPGDLIEVRLHVTPTGEWIDQVTKTGSRPLPGELTDAPPPPVDLLDPGDLVDAPRFVSQDGTPWTLESAARHGRRDHVHLLAVPDCTTTARSWIDGSSTRRPACSPRRR